ncbi:hypothetical protein BLA29_014195 [Euroglyphus maynei]|uniref:Uncharacterized protein n=1 Tax=Euroglyphus maynei TaxID=6958 RepID=A0A1Y3BPA8_EURMA|nr:hypothetical protein BLA29_014195 [Euroglyphus maynei]
MIHYKHIILYYVVLIRSVLMRKYSQNIV